MAETTKSGVARAGGVDDVYSDSGANDGEDGESSGSPSSPNCCGPMWIHTGEASTSKVFVYNDEGTEKAPVCRGGDMTEEHPMCGCEDDEATLNASTDRVFVYNDEGTEKMPIGCMGDTYDNDVDSNSIESGSGKVFVVFDE